MPHTAHDMLYAAILTLATTLAVGGAAWLLLFPFSHPPADSARIDWTRRF